MKTHYQQSSKMKKNWHLIDATDCVLGRLSNQIARLLQGKHKIEWAPHIDSGDFVVLINADKIHLSGKKWLKKSYYSHSRHIGSLKQKQAHQIKPKQLIQKAVQGMLSKNKLRKQMMKKLKIYEGSEHPHQAQNPVLLQQTKMD